MRIIKFFLLFFFFFFGNSAFSSDTIAQLIEKSKASYYSDPVYSFSLIQKAKEVANTTNNHQLDGEIAVYEARYYILVTKYELATNALNKSINIFQSNQNKSRLSYAYSLKSILFGRIGEKEKELRLQLTILQLNRELRDTTKIIFSLQNISLNFLEINELDSAKINLEELATLKKKITPTGFYYYHQNWGSYYAKKNLFRLAIKHFEKAKKVAEKHDMIDSKATILVQISSLYRINNSLELAEKNGVESLTLSKKNNLIYETADALEELVLVKEAQKNYVEAYRFQKEWQLLEKKIFNIEKAEKIKMIEGQLEIAEKEKIITQAKADLQTEKLIVEKAKTKNLWMSAVVIFVLSILSFTVFFYAKTKRLNTTIHAQKQEVELKSKSLQEALKSIKDSIEYSKRIQNAILPPLAEIKDCLPDSFVLYKPKDIVAGDFYWLEKKENKIIFAAADCTGHGVPGAMVSVVCNNALNRSVREYGLTDPGEILTKSRAIVIQEFEKSDEDVKDGMDIALCSLEGNILKFAGANNPLWIIRDGALIETKGNKQPVGKFFKQVPFTTHTFELQDKDVFYLFSDGFVDQFGGVKGKKFKVKAFKSLLIEAHSKALDKQKNFIDDVFENWKGSLEQLDDVCVIGVRYSSL